MKKLFVIFALVTSFGCSATPTKLTQIENTPDVVENIQEPFKISAISSGVSELKKHRIIPNSISTSNILKTYDLGSLKSSREISFMISNNLSSKISTISIQSSSNYITFSISKLEYLDSKLDGGIDVFDVGIEHGSRINGVGPAPLLSGEMTPTFSVTGYVVQGKNTIKVKSVYGIKFNAKYSSIDLIADGVSQDLSKPKNTLTCPYGNAGTASYYEFKANTNLFQIKNTGNTSITVKQLGHGGDFGIEKMAIKTIGEGQTVTININPRLNTEVGYWVEIDTAGVAVDLNTLSRGQNGKFYFEIYRFPN